MFQSVSGHNSEQSIAHRSSRPSFPSVFFQLLQYSRQHPSFSAYKAALIFPAFSLRFVNFAVQFYFCFFPPEAIRVKFDSDLIFLEQSQLLRMATNEIVSFCVDKRLRQMASFSLSPLMPLFCSYHILTSTVIYYWTDVRQHGIYLLNR